MSQAYTPGLEITPHTLVTKTRELPLSGRVLVKPGDVVTSQTPVLAADLPGDLEIVRVADRLGMLPEDVASLVKLKPGDVVHRGDVIVEMKTFFGLFTARVECSADGTVEFFTEGNAHLGIRGPSEPLVIRAYIDGTVLECEEGKSATIQSAAALVQGIFGVGGEREGEVLTLDCPLDARIDAPFIDRLDKSCGRADGLRGTVLVGGSSFSADALEACAKAGVSAVVTGSVDSKTLRSFVGHEIGVSITGDEEVALTLIITEGFGVLPISQRVVDLARTLHGRRASVNGATQVRAGAMRPELIVPHERDALDSAGSSQPSQRALDVGSRVRIVRVPYFGRFATVTDLPHEPAKVPSGAIVRVLRARLDEGNDEVLVPRANVELV